MVPVMQTTKARFGFGKTAATIAAVAKSLPQRYFVSPEIFAEEATTDLLEATVGGRRSEPDLPLRQPPIHGPRIDAHVRVACEQTMPPLSYTNCLDLEKLLTPQKPRSAAPTPA
jgi:hypothetical protein